MQWSTRLQLEKMSHTATSFITLTYRDDQMPLLENGLATLRPLDLSLWLKRLRIAFQRKTGSNSSLRYYAAGEYGDKHQRPHYHLILYGYPPCAYGSSRYADGRTIDCCFQCDLVRDTWNMGIIENKIVTPGHTKYVAGYVMKKMTSKHDARLNGRHPEFSRQSKMNGGLGIGAVKQLAAVSKQRLDAGTTDDVAFCVRIDGKVQILDRYMRKKIRKEIGLDEKAPPSVLQKVEQEMLALQIFAQTDKEDITLKKQLVRRAASKIASIKARHEMNNSRKRNNSL